jgi:hypothetical protein
MTSLQYLLLNLNLKKQMLQIIVTNPIIERTTVNLHDLNMNAWQRIIAVKTMLDDTTRVGIIVKVTVEQKRHFLEGPYEHHNFTLYFSEDVGFRTSSCGWKELIGKNQLDGLKFYFV